MNMESLRLAIRILADQRGSQSEYKKILQFTGKLYGLPAETLDQLVLCHLADEAD
jgi:hypothetical protein